MVRSEQNYDRYFIRGGGPTIYYYLLLLLLFTVLYRNDNRLRWPCDNDILNYLMMYYNLALYSRL